MGASIFNEMELDAVGEIMNISLGASATAVSTMLGTMVNITTPGVSVLTRDEFEFKRLEPAVGVEIAYVEGLEGSNIMVFRRNDVRIIVGMLMGEEVPDEDFELDEINISAICEVMNQMMGSSATALSEFLGNPVNISTPVSFEIRDDEAFKSKYYVDNDIMVVVRFMLEIEGKLKSEFLNIMSIELTKRLLAPFFGPMDETPVEETAAEPESADTSSLETPQAEQPPVQEQQAMPEQPMAQDQDSMQPQPAVQEQVPMQPQPAVQEQVPMQPQPAVQEQVPMQPQPAAQEQIPAMQPQQAVQEQVPVLPQPGVPVQPAMQVPPVSYAAPVYQAGPDPMILQLMNQMQQSQVQMMEMMRDMQKAKEKRPAENSVIRAVNQSALEDDLEDREEEEANREMLMKVPLEISVEIGRTKKRVKDILEFTQGSLVVLDKMAGEQADLFVNGQCIARGDIVVVEDNFGIRITEVVSRNINPESL